jgi:hypothetical protein
MKVVFSNTLEEYIKGYKVVVRPTIKYFVKSWWETWWKVKNGSFDGVCTILYSMWFNI